MTLQDLVIRQDKMADLWDELLPKDLEKEWKVWYEQLSELDTIRVARCMREANSKANDLTLHVFCDASKTAFASCAYIVSKEKDEARESRLLIAKARVAPVKVVTVPRLELLGAVLSTSLVACINSNLDHPFCERNTYYWTDSMNVLCWLRNQSCDLKTFVANHVLHFQRHSDISQWRYINTTQNPADLATRGLSVEQLQNSDLWWKGPELLLADEPIAHDEPRIPLLEAVKEFRPSKAPFAQSSGWTVQLMAVTSSTSPSSSSAAQNSTGLAILTPKVTSSWAKRVRITAYVVRFSRKRWDRYCKKYTSTVLEPKELKEATIIQAMLAQRDDGLTDSSRELNELDPYYGPKGELRPQGRLKYLKKLGVEMS